MFATLGLVASRRLNHVSAYESVSTNIRLKRVTEQENDLTRRLITRSTSRWWIVFCAASFLALVALGVSLVSTPSQRSNAPIESVAIELTGHDHHFYLRYSGGDSVLQTADDRFGVDQLLVPQNATVRLSLRSLDLIYVIDIESLEIYEAAVPGADFETVFQASKLGEHKWLAPEVCGYTGQEFLAKLIVLSPRDFRRAMSESSCSPSLNNVLP